ncbi:hypothetical protein ABIA39_007043 [Nocardia sp. GAS34]
MTTRSVGSGDQPRARSHIGKSVRSPTGPVGAAPVQNGCHSKSRGLPGARPYLRAVPPAQTVQISDRRMLEYAVIRDEPGGLDTRWRCTAAEPKPSAPDSWRTHTRPRNLDAGLGSRHPYRHLPRRSRRPQPAPQLDRDCSRTTDSPHDTRSTCIKAISNLEPSHGIGGNCRTQWTAESAHPAPPPPPRHRRPTLADPPSRRRADAGKAMSHRPIGSGFQPPTSGQDPERPAHNHAGPDNTGPHEHDMRPTCPSTDYGASAPIVSSSTARC